MMTEEERNKITPLLAHACCNDTHIIDKRGNVYEVSAITHKKAKKLLAYKLLSLRRNLEDINLLLSSSVTEPSNMLQRHSGAIIKNFGVYAPLLKLPKSLQHIPKPVPVIPIDEKHQRINNILNLAIMQLESGASVERILAILKQTRGEKDD
tara:strand:- start:474 stop:929 length:456 start_codon:yes stop_codon:yes gene_type:complete